MTMTAAAVYTRCRGAPPLLTGAILPSPPRTVEASQQLWQPPPTAAAVSVTPARHRQERAVCCLRLERAVRCRQQEGAVRYHFLEDEAVLLAPATGREREPPPPDADGHTFRWRVWVGDRLVLASVAFRVSQARPPSLRSTPRRLHGILTGLRFD